MIRVHSIFKAFGGRELFGGLSLAVDRGESLAILGPSGAGKTTLLQILGGLVALDGGDVELEGQRLDRLSPRRRARLRAGRVGFVFQGSNLLPHLTVLENVALPGAFGPRPIEAAAAETALARVGLVGRGPQLGSTLSGGEEQRVAVARAVAQRPGVLLCDEPTGSLDGKMAAQVTTLLLETAHDVGCALVVATHDESLAVSCSRTLRLGTPMPESMGARE